MFTRRKSFNPKRHFAVASTTENLNLVAGRVRYGGNAEHKSNPGDFGLTPPVSPRADKTLCDGANIFSRELDLGLLKQGVLRGLVSEQVRNGFPQNIWAVSGDGLPLEAQLENAQTGTYHGYPMPSADPFRDKVLKKWATANEQADKY
jgi:hypothetical protein